MTLNIEKVNSIDYEEFIEIFGNVVEHCPMIAAAVLSKRPFRDVNTMHREICLFIDALPSSGHEGILRCHPDLAGRLAEAGRLTTESSQEQVSAELNTLTENERHTLSTANASYKSKFHFPFVICARQNKKSAIIEGIKHRAENTFEEELLNGIEEVKKICYLRLLNIVKIGSNGKL